MNWFSTLNQALESEGLLESWDCFWSPINYGETRKYSIEILPGQYIPYRPGSKITLNKNKKKSIWHHVSITRDNQGMYERPVHYSL